MTQPARKIVLSCVSALAIAFAGFVSATPAHAAATLSSIIDTPENQLYSAYATKRSPDGNIQAIPAYDTDRVVLVFADTLTYATVADPNGDISAPRALAFSPDGSTIYVANYGSTNITIIDVASRAVTGTFNGGDDEATTIGVSPDGSKILVVADGNNINIFDVNDNFNQSASVNGASGSEYLQVYFTTNDQAWVVNLTANAYLVNLTEGMIERSFDNQDAGGYGVCANADFSRLVWVSSDNHATVVNTADGSTAGILDLVGVTTNASMCAVTNTNKLLISDYVDDPSKMLVVDLATLAIEQTLELPGLPFANGIDVMNGCVALVEGYYTNIGVVALSEGICTKPALPDTGLDSTSARIWTIVGFLALGAGAFSLMTRRRRN